MYVTRKASEEIMHRVESYYLEMHIDKTLKGLRSVVKWKISDFMLFIIIIDFYLIAD